MDFHFQTIRIWECALPRFAQHGSDNLTGGFSQSAVAMLWGVIRYEQVDASFIHKKKNINMCFIIRRQSEDIEL